MNKFDAVANIALFLTETKGSCLATWDGTMTAKQQRAMFGCFIGKGRIVIDGTKETIQHIIKVCFGHDYDVTFQSRFHAIADVAANQNNKGY